MNEFSAAVGLIQLKKLEKLNKRRFQIVKKYYQKINIENKMPLSEDCSYHIFWIRVKKRDEFMKNLLKKGIETGIHYKPIHLMKYYSKSRKLPISEKIWKELVSIPMHPNLTDEEVERVITKINKFV